MQSISIGVAGYMGSGKSTFCKMLSNLSGIAILDADAEAKKIIIENNKLQEQIVALFGPELFENGILSFKKLGNIVFKDIKNLHKYNTIIHPVLLNSWQNMIFTTRDNAIIFDAALLPLWNIEKWFSHLVWINTIAGTRLKRIIEKKMPTDSVKTIQQRMRMQEKLFAPPSSTSWSYIYNEEDTAELSHSAEQYVKQHLHQFT